MSTLKVGDKVQLLYDSDGFTKGQIVEVYELGLGSAHLFKGDNSLYSLCDGKGGAYLSPRRYRVLDDTPEHPHADLMLKYAILAQYDDKPWEHFEVCSDLFPTWEACEYDLRFYPDLKYRLKPQIPVVQVGQAWVSRSNGQEVQVFRKPRPSEGGCGEVEKWVIGVVLDESINLVTSVVILELDLIKHFKLKK